MKKLIIPLLFIFVASACNKIEDPIKQLDGDLLTKSSDYEYGLMLSLIPGVWDGAIHNLDSAHITLTTALPYNITVYMDIRYIDSTGIYLSPSLDCPEIIIPAGQRYAKGALTSAIYMAPNGQHYYYPTIVKIGNVVYNSSEKVYKDRSAYSVERDYIGGYTTIMGSSYYSQPGFINIKPPYNVITYPNQGNGGTNPPGGGPGPGDGPVPLDPPGDPEIIG